MPRLSQGSFADRRLAAQLNLAGEAGEMSNFSMLKTKGITPLGFMPKFYKNNIFKKQD
jgi:hypothetical protein